MTHMVCLSREISNYHDARYAECSTYFDRFTVLTSVEDAEFDEFLSKKTRTYEFISLFDSLKDYYQSVKKAKLEKKMYVILNELNPDVLAISGWASPESILSIKWAFEKRVPIVVMSASQKDDAKRGWFREFIKSRIVSLCNSGLVGGEPQKSYLASLGIPRDAISLGYNAVDNSYFAEKSDIVRKNSGRHRAKHDLPGEYILASGRFIEKKNFEILVEVYGNIRKKNVNTPELVILGHGRKINDIQASIKRFGVEKFVHLKGFKSYEELPIYYGLSLGFVLISKSEQWGLVINEAMASGLPVVVSDRCGVSRSIFRDPEHGWKVDPFDVNSITKGLEQLLFMSSDKRKEMGLSARKEIFHWGPERFALGLKTAADYSIRHYEYRRIKILDRILLVLMSKKMHNEVS